MNYNADVAAALDRDVTDHCLATEDRAYDLAEMMSIKGGTLSNKRAGKAPVTADDLIRLAIAGRYGALRELVALCGCQLTTPTMPNFAAAVALEQVGEISKETSDLVRVGIDALADKEITQCEYEDCMREAGELSSKVDGFMRSLRAAKPRQRQTVFG